MNFIKEPVRKVLLIAVIIGGITSCSAFAQTKKLGLQTGIWQGTLHRVDGKNIAFNFSVENKNGSPVWYIHNAGERLLVDSIHQHADSLLVQMPFFASGFKLVIKSNNQLQGVYIKSYGAKGLQMPFTAVHGVSYRYKATAHPLYNITGKWETYFGEQKKQDDYAIGEFEQNPNGIVTGTFRTPTGDYRYLEGRVNGDNLLLSGFDGGHAVLFCAKIKNDTTLSDGFVYSGSTGKQGWAAVKNNSAQLPNGFEMTKMRPGETSLSFRFPSTDGKMVSINDERYKNKVVVVQVLGSWCPNCMDETAFLSQYYNKNKQRGIEIIGLAYERTEDFNESKQALQSFQKKFDVQYPFLITGVTAADDHKTEKTLPQLDELQAFPTTIFIGKSGTVDKIHAGYDGPATGEHYEVFKKEFDEEINNLLKE